MDDARRAAPIELPLYHHWAFHTTRRRRLRGARPSAEAAQGRAGPRVVRGRVRPAPRRRRWPCAARSSPPRRLRRTVPADVAATTLAALTAPLGDAAHPVVGLPDHAGPWPAEPPDPAPGWRDAAAPRLPRAAPWLGSAARPGSSTRSCSGREAARLAGAYEEAAERLRRLRARAARLALAVEAPRAGRRPCAGWAMLGPALRDVLTADGRSPRVMEHPDRALERSLFSSAARRALRRAGRPAPPCASRPPRPPRPRAQRAAALIHTDAFARATSRARARRRPRRRPRRATQAHPHRLRRAWPTALDRSGLRPRHGRLRRSAAARPSSTASAADARRADPAAARARRQRANGSSRERRACSAAGARRAEPDSDDLAALGARVARRSGAAGRQRRSTSTGASAEIADGVRSDRRAPVDRRSRAGWRHRRRRRRARSRPTAPVELAPDLDLPAWQFLRDHAPGVAAARRRHDRRGQRHRLDHQPGLRRRLPARAQRAGRRRAALPQLPADPGLDARCVRSGTGANAATAAHRRRHPRHRRPGRATLDVRLARAPDPVGVERRPRRALQHAALPRVPGHARLPRARRCATLRRARLGRTGRTSTRASSPRSRGGSRPT